MFRPPRVNSCNSFSDFAEAHEVTEIFVRLIVAIERYLEPQDFVAGSDGSSGSTFSDGDAGHSAEVTELASEFADARPLEKAGASSASPQVRWAHAVAEREERWKDIQARMNAMDAFTKRN
eukprot:2803167-Pleurochrysis_carterae.AAC.2